ncbi:motile sperm domain-containing protein 2 isoform X2 [Microcaecilia unicolor]|uniref:Motile sperm domain-containing protein 2 isoform X2 n=1 Tax=Microcaecilia unicolor TaxID=1415580 RepID=A0A6P7XQ07_9AMPH|nr:motile sperm domain-containing protein 2 isoform X2 [Microcaecilia unicolor]
MADDRGRLIPETRKRFQEQYLPDKANKYDSRDVERLCQDDTWVESYLAWRHNVVDDTLKMIDESFQWRKEFSVNDLNETNFPKCFFEVGAVFLHGYDKEGNKLFWFKVKLHIKDSKTQLEKKKCTAFWLERYAKREPGKLLTVVFDMAETGFSNIDMDFVRFVINCFKVYYPKYLSKIVIFEMPWIMNAAFKIVKSWLGPEAVNMLKFTNRNDVQDYISAEYLPTHMGGSDPFKYSYPPLPDDDFQTPICESGPIAGDDEAESKEEIESENRDRGEPVHSDDQMHKPKKLNYLEEVSKTEECDRMDSKMKYSKKALSVFRGPLLHISPAEDYILDLKKAREKCLIILTNVTKNAVAFKVKTTAPEKYRVKPSNSSCEPGSSLEITVSLHGGCTASLQDRFLVVAAEIDQASGFGASDLALFWKEVQRNKVMEHRLRCHVTENIKPTTLLIKEHSFDNGPAEANENMHLKLLRLLEVNKRLQEQIDRCVWFQQVLLALVSLQIAFYVYILNSQKS